MLLITYCVSVHYDVTSGLLAALLHNDEKLTDPPAVAKIPEETALQIAERLTTVVHPRFDLLSLPL